VASARARGRQREGERCSPNWIPGSRFRLHGEKLVLLGSDAGSTPLKTQATTVVVAAKAALLQRSRRTINAPSLSLALARAPARPPTPTHWD